MDTKAFFDHDGGQVVSVFTFNYDNPISNLGEVFSFSLFTSLKYSYLDWQLVFRPPFELLFMKGQFPKFLERFTIFVSANSVKGPTRERTTERTNEQTDYSYFSLNKNEIKCELGLFLKCVHDVRAGLWT